MIYLLYFYYNPKLKQLKTTNAVGYRTHVGLVFFRKTKNVKLVIVVSQHETKDLHIRVLHISKDMVSILSVLEAALKMRVRPGASIWARLRRPSREAVAKRRFGNILC